MVNADCRSGWTDSRVPGPITLALSGLIFQGFWTQNTYSMGLWAILSLRVIMHDVQRLSAYFGVWWPVTVRLLGLPGRAYR